jgi:hypothetical protein
VSQSGQVLYQQKQLPTLQNRVYDSREEAMSCAVGDLELIQDTTTGLIYNIAFRPELLVYDKHYQNEQALSPFFQDHLHTVAEIINRSIGRDGIVEVGCGKGTFLELLLSKGFDITGFDPAYEGTNPRITACGLTPELGITASGLVLRHVLEHIPNPIQFLMQLKQANSGDGKIYIEVPCFDWICEHHAWFDVFYEHVNYFRLADLCAMFGKVIESGRIFGGQYLYVVAELASLRNPEYSAECQVDFPNDFAQGINDPPERGTNGVAVWGASSKGVIFSILKARAGFSIDTVIDINPAKHNKYLPLTGLLVQSPEQALSRLGPGATIYVMNCNYLAEIRKMSGNAYHYVGVENG